ncbi:peptidyl-tRNA hydrolase [Vibrio mediterranei]|uniref:peptidyl-tRNA hydrolase n=1 Tax=Vibrio mediterranei TaxID=689 RepID=UPI004068A0D3
MKIYIRNDIEMPLGKKAAQVAHAINAIVLERMKAQVTDSHILLEPTVAIKKIARGAQFPDFEIIECDLASMTNLVDSETSFIRDAGRTVFSEPTITVGWSAEESLGDRVDEGRLRFYTDSIPFKQPIFVNRANKALTDDYVLKTVAKLSTDLILSYSDDKGLIALPISSPMARWLTNAIGKTVVGCKKHSHFDKTIEPLMSLESGKYRCEKLNEHASVFVFSPISSDEIERFTRTKHTQLLSNL